MHDWYGRYLYFAPDELEPLGGAGDPDQREESVPVKAIGILTTVLAGLVLAGAVVLGVRSLPDVKRYLAMRRM